MPRVARIVIPHLAHHVTQRGNNRQDVFLDDADRRTYLAILAEQSRLHGVRVLGYCLMSNHTHLVLIPSRADGLARAVGRTHWLYARYFNNRHKRSGHLWQNRFYSTPLEDESCVLVMRYVETNPCRAGIRRSARGFEWSSAAAHCAVGKTTEIAAGGLLDLQTWKRLLADLDWSRELNAGADALSEAELTRVRRATQAGRLLARPAFIERLEGKFGKSLHAAPVGRPKHAAGTNKRKEVRSAQNR